MQCLADFGCMSATVARHIDAQVGQQSGNSLTALLSIVEAEGVGGLFVGGGEQLMREIPFNAIQFTVYEVRYSNCLFSCVCFF